MTSQIWAKLVPELSVSHFATSLNFYQDLLGFKVLYSRAEDNFAYLELEGAQLMIEEANGHWATGSLEHPFGRGVNFQIELNSIRELYERIVSQSVPLFQELQENWYRSGNQENGQVEFLIQDPDGYLLRFCEHLGVRDSKKLPDSIVLDTVL